MNFGNCAKELKRNQRKALLNGPNTNNWMGSPIRGHTNLIGS